MHTSTSNHQSKNVLQLHTNEKKKNVQQLIWKKIGSILMQLRDKIHLHKEWYRF